MRSIRYYTNVHHVARGCDPVITAVGISDLQQFDKFIREYYGLSPRALRDTDSV